jgi:hypothetical protein
MLFAVASTPSAAATESAPLNGRDIAHLHLLRCAYCCTIDMEIE